MNQLIINQAAARTITMGASSTVQYYFYIMYNIIINLKDYKNKLKLN
jgi:hypothetical protein